MAQRKPLVLVGGQIQQLQSGDTLNVPSSGAEIVSQTNDESVTLNICTPVYNDANDGVKRAQANAASTSNVVGLVYDATIANGVAGNIQVNGVFAAATANWDAVFGTSGGLTKGTRYFLSAGTVGTALSTPPSTAGQYVVQLGIAMSTTELLLASPFAPILL